MRQDGITGLIRASHNGHVELARLLLDYKADSNLADKVLTPPTPPDSLSRVLSTHTPYCGARQYVPSWRASPVPIHLTKGPLAFVSLASLSSGSFIPRFKRSPSIHLSFSA